MELLREFKRGGVARAAPTGVSILVLMELLRES